MVLSTLNLKMFIQIVILNELICCVAIINPDSLTNQRSGRFFHKNQTQPSVNALYAIILKLGWQNFVIFMDDTTFDLSLALIQKLISHGQMGTIFHVHQSIKISVAKFFQDHLKGYRNFLLFCSEKSTVEQLKTISTNRLISTHFSWLFMIPEALVDWKKIVLQMKFVKPDNLIVMSPVTSNISANGYEIYKSNAVMNSHHIYRIDTWFHQSGFRVNTVFQPRRFSIRGANLTLAVLHDPPYVVFKNTTRGIQVGGLDIDVLTLVAEKLNFSYHILKDNGTIYGNLINGSWTGLLGYLQRKEADFCLPSLSPTSLRRTVADISAPISSAFSRFLIRRPQTILNFQTYIAPFSPIVWLLLLASCGAFFIGFTITRPSDNRLRQLHQWTETKNSVIGDSGHGFSDGKFQQAIMSCICFLTQRGFEPFPEEISSRIMLTTLFFLCLILMGCYNSVLVALLSVDQNRMPFDSMESLLDNFDYKVGYVKGSAYEELLKKKSKCEDSGVFNKLYEKVMKYPDNVVNSNEEGIEKAFKERYAFFSWVDGLVYEIGQNCSYIFAGDKYLLRNYGISFPKNSPYIEEVSRELLKLRETGVLMKMQQKYFPSQSYCIPKKVSKPLGFGHILPLFVALLCGLILSVIVLIIELLYCKVKKFISNLRFGFHR